MKRVWMAAPLVATGLLMSGCINPFSDAPRNLAECRAAAVKLPTERGVTIALGDCQKTFVTDPTEAKRKTVEQEWLAAWKRSAAGEFPTTLATVKLAMGEPAAAGLEHPCLDAAKKPMFESCMWYEWESGRPKELCPTSMGGPEYGAFMYRAEFSMDSGALKRVFPTAQSDCATTLSAL